MKNSKKLVSDMIKKDRRSKNALTFSKPSMPSSPSEGFKNVAAVFKDLAKPSPIVSASRGAAIGGISGIGIGKAMTATPKFSSTPSPRITIPVQPRPIQPRIPSPLPKSGKQYWLPEQPKTRPLPGPGNLGGSLGEAMKKMTQIPPEARLHPPVTPRPITPPKEKIGKQRAPFDPNPKMRYGPFNQM